jgi:hypothetical protein
VVAPMAVEAVVVAEPAPVAPESTNDM